MHTSLGAMTLYLGHKYLRKRQTVDSTTTPIYQNVSDATSGDAATKSQPVGKKGRIIKMPYLSAAPYAAMRSERERAL